MRRIAASSAGLVLALVLTGSSGAVGSNAQGPAWDDSSSIAKPPPAPASTAAPSVPDAPEPDSASSLTNEQVHEAISILHEYDPERAQRLEDRFHVNPFAARASIAPIFAKLTSINYLRTHNPELFKYRLQDFQMDYADQAAAADYRRAVDSKDKNVNAKAPALLAQLQARVRAHFALRQEMEEHEVAMLEKKIALLRQQIEARKTAKDKLITDHIDELTGMHTRAEW